MKKFGTPSGAAPGSANEKVGFETVGTPPGPIGGGGFEGAFFEFVDVDFFCVEDDELFCGVVPWFTELPECDPDEGLLWCEEPELPDDG